MSKMALAMCHGNPKEILESVMALFKGISVKKFLTPQLYNLMSHLVFHSAQLGITKPIDFIADQMQVCIFLHQQWCVYIQT
jgi:hypothetical protein